MKNIERKYRLQAFFLSMVTAIVAILPVVIYSKGFLILYGDYNLQEIPFYKTCIEAIHSGNLGWSWNTNMGASLLGAYSFYTLGSPFFWLACLFPASWSMYLMAPLLVLKISFSGLFAHIYLRRFVARPQSALIGALLYAFSGYSLLNSVFFHFHEVICFFPLLLIGLEEAVVCKRRAVFALSVAVCAAVNYFFFIGECVFLVLYFITRLVSDTHFRINVRDFFCLAFESVIGVAVAGIIFVPSIAYVLSMERVGVLIHGANILTYNDPLTLFQTIKSMFLPPNPFSKSYFLESGETSWRSVSVYLPMFSIAGVVAFFFGAEKKSWIKRLLIVCAVFAAIPVLNSAFVLFSYEYYARWYFMPVLIMCLATARAVESEKFSWKRGSIIALAGVVFLVLFYFFAPYEARKKVGNDVDGYQHIYVLENLIQQKDLHWEILLLMALSLGGIITTIFLIRSRKKLPADKFMENAVSLTVVFCIITSCLTFFEARLAGPALDSYNNSIARKYEFNDDDDDFYRVYADGMINFNMMWGYASTQCFHSLFPSSTSDFLKAIGQIDYEVSVAPGANDYAYNALTRTKYIMSGDVFGINKNEYYDDNKLARVLESDSTVYKNEYMLPMACSYDTYCTLADVKRSLPMGGASAAEQLFISAVTSNTAEEQDELEMNKTTNLMVHSVALKSEDIDRYSDILTHDAPDKLSLDVEQFKSDIADRQTLSADDFEITKTGFVTHTSYDTDRILVFSIAYDKGWSATANGVKLEPHSANVGFIAVRVPAGEQEIEFTFTPTGFKAGVAVTIFGIVALAVYAVVIYVVLKKRPLRLVPIGEDKLPSLHTEYMSENDKDSGDNDV